MNSIGQRVGAIFGDSENGVKIFGYGTYIGDEIPPKESGGFGKMLNEIGHTNPCIQLDNGKKVFGCECWWGPEESIKKKLEGHKIITIDIDEARKNWENA